MNEETVGVDIVASATPLTQPIRVLLIAPALRITGGQAVQAERLVAELSQDPSVSIDFMPIAPVFRGPFRVLQSIRYLRTILTFLSYMPLVFWNVPRYDILHIFSASYWSYALWSMPPLLVGKLLGKKVVLNYRSGEAEDHLTRWRLAAPTIRLADVIVSPSGYPGRCVCPFRVESPFYLQHHRSEQVPISSAPQTTPSFF